MEHFNQIESDFKYPVFAVAGRDALSAWEMLKSKHANSAWPIVVGSREDFEILREGIEYGASRAPSELVSDASSLDFPEGFKQFKIQESERLWEEMQSDPNAKAFLEAVGIENSAYPTVEDLMGTWPDEPIDQSQITGLSIAQDWETEEPMDEALIVLIPTSDWTHVSAFLNYGGWNDCPPAEWHVAALRYWGEAYECELVGLSYDSMNIRTLKRPTTRANALELALEQYYYCGDIVEQGVGEISVLAQILKSSNWWDFWWD
ncbi:MAG: DUF4253 domain-containing protein [Pseudomonadota bacterium]